MTVVAVAADRLWHAWKTATSCDPVRDVIGDTDIGARAGLGRNSLGNPLVAAVWLADELARRGTPLQAGDLVMTGALGPMVAVGRGDGLHADFGSLRQVGCRLSPTVDQTTPYTKPSQATKDTR